MAPHRERRPAPVRKKRLPATPAPRVVRERRAPLHCEIVTVGREVLRGRIRDENARHLAAELSLRGGIVHRIATVDDNERSIASAIHEALERGAHLVVTSGGLGPSADDKTMAGVSDALRLPLSLHPGARRLVEEAYRRLADRRVVSGGGLTAAREKLATIPIGAEPIENPEGVAPGVLLRRTGGGAVLCLPGVPDEARVVLERALESLRELFPQGVASRREVEAPTPDESVLRTILARLSEEFPGIWIQVRTTGFGRRRRNAVVSLETFAPTSLEAEDLLDRAVKRLLSLAASP